MLRSIAIQRYIIIQTSKNAVPSGPQIAVTGVKEFGSAVILPLDRIDIDLDELNPVDPPFGPCKTLHPLVGKYITCHINITRHR